MSEIGPIFYPKRGKKRKNLPQKAKIAREKNIRKIEKTRE